MGQVDLVLLGFTLGWAHVAILLVTLQRLAEVAYASRNTRALLAQGGREAGAGHYPVMALLHASWLVAMFVFTQPNPEPSWTLLALFALLQVLRVWVIATLGPYWTTRVITLDRAPAVATGPYRYIRHPNYLIVAIEIPLLPLALGLPLVALVFGVLNLALLAWRIRIENEARSRILDS